MSAWSSQGSIPTAGLTLHHALPLLQLGPNGAGKTTTMRMCGECGQQHGHFLLSAHGASSMQGWRPSVSADGGTAPHCIASSAEGFMQPSSGKVMIEG